jgi:hypothetical protein
MRHTPVARCAYCDEHAEVKETVLKKVHPITGHEGPKGSTVIDLLFL